MENATDVINSLQMRCNHDHQAAITNEVVEFITGASCIANSFTVYYQFLFVLVVQDASALWAE